jgi:tetratricopeptide (TPR) repeat protein
MSPFCLRSLSAFFLVVALCAKLGVARAGDLEDCNGVLPAKSEPACTAVINESSRSVDDRLKAYVSRARAYLETARLDLALGDLNTAISINPNLPAAFFWRGQVYRRKGDVDRAIEDLTRAIIQAGGIDRAAYLARAQLFTSKGDYARAIADFDKLLSVAPDDKAVQQQRQSAIAMQTELARVHEGPPAAPSQGAVQGQVAASPPPQMTLPGTASPSAAPLIEQGRQLMAQRRFAEALARFNQILAADPRNETALQSHSIALFALGRFAESKADMDTLIKLKPNDAQLLATRGMTSIGLKQLDQATADIDRAISLDPNNAVAYLGRGMAERMTGKFKDAITDFDRSIVLNPKDSSAFAERGQAYMSLNQIDKAVVDFDQAIVLNQANDQARAARGLALLLKGSNAEGLVDIKNALDRNPNNQLAQLGQGLAMLVSGQYDRSIVALNQLVGKSAAFETFARLLRARAHIGQHDTDSAMADLDAVLGRQPNNSDGLLLRGMVWSSKHDYAKALDDLSGAIAQRESVEGYFARAKIYEAQNNSTKAAQDYRRATELKPSSVFDALAQAQSQQKIKQLAKQLPCGSDGRAAGANSECL